MTGPRVMATPIGTPCYAIDDKQRTIRGVFGRTYGPCVTVETYLGTGVTRRRLFHGRYVVVDHWRILEDLP